MHMDMDWDMNMDTARNPDLRAKRLRRQLDSIIIHFDYDCFYAAVFENETPAYRKLPLAVQQKQIVVTCNYEARRQGLHKLQLITEAKKICPDVVIVLGEDLTRFRLASKQNCSFLTSFSWNNKAERLGFDEVFMDVSDIIEYNAGLLNQNQLSDSWFCLKKDDPTAGFLYDASIVAGHTYPEVEVETESVDASQQRLRLHLTLASHLAKHLRQQLTSTQGYTCTVGISTNKLLSKLVGNVHKPNGQTTLLPPYIIEDESLPPSPLDKTSKADAGNNVSTDNVTAFLDEFEIGKLPGIGFKTAQKIRTHVLQRKAEFDDGLLYGGTKEVVTVRNVRMHPGMGPDTLERILAAPGTPQGLGGKIWALLNGCDDTEVGLARTVPTQISIEDSYVRLDTIDQVNKELRMLAQSIMRRMHADLLEDEEDVEPIKHVTDVSVTEKRLKRWLAHPKTLRLSTRPRLPPQNADGSRNRSFARISRSAPLPNFVFSLKAADTVEVLAERLVHEALIPLFKKLHPEKHGWNLSLVNVAVTGMVEGASEKGGAGRDISKMFKNQDNVLKEWRVNDGIESQDTTMDEDIPGMHSAAQAPKTPELSRGGSEDFPTLSQEDSTRDNGWEDEDEDMNDDDTFTCEQCGAAMPIYAMVAHSRWHGLG